MSSEQDKVSAAGQQSGQGGGGQKSPEKPPEPNVILARKPGDDGEYVKPLTVDGPVNMGVVTIELPDEEAQRRGFYLDPRKAALLLTQFPHLYKTALNVGPSKQAPPEPVKKEGPNGDETK